MHRFLRWFSRHPGRRRRQRAHLQHVSTTTLVDSREPASGTPVREIRKEELCRWVQMLGAPYQDEELPGGFSDDDTLDDEEIARRSSDEGIRHDEELMRRSSDDGTGVRDWVFENLDAWMNRNRSTSIETMADHSVMLAVITDKLRNANLPHVCVVFPEDKSSKIRKEELMEELRRRRDPWVLRIPMWFSATERSSKKFDREVLRILQSSLITQLAQLVPDVFDDKTGVLSQYSFDRLRLYLARTPEYYEEGLLIIKALLEHVSPDTYFIFSNMHGGERRPLYPYWRTKEHETAQYQLFQMLIDHGNRILWVATSLQIDRLWGYRPGGDKGFPGGTKATAVRLVGFDKPYPESVKDIRELPVRENKM